MNKITTYSFCESFIDNLMQFIDEHYIKKNKDLSRLAIVFGGKRPALFLKRELARKLNKSFFPPRFFTIDEFIGYVVAQEEPFANTKDLEQCYLLYKIAKKVTPHILKGRESFAEFLPWTREILRFIEQLDLENVPADDLRHIEANAQIGYAVPDDINQLLESVVVLREAYHEYSLKQKVYPRGFQYLRAGELVADLSFDEFDQMLFCNFFYFNRTEEKVAKNLYERDKALFFFQGDERKWPVLNRISRSFASPIQEGEKPQTPKFDLKLYSGFDAHSQVCLVREILKNIQNFDNTVIVLPNPDNIIPLLSEITPLIKDFNISMGYPLKRSSLYSLFDFMFSAQLSRRLFENGQPPRGEFGYYTRDYLKVLRHPLVKNLKVADSAVITRVLVHKLEEILTGQEKNAVSGSVFVKLEELLDLEELYQLAAETLQGMGVETTQRDLKQVLSEINSLMFHEWENINNFNKFAAVLENFLAVFIRDSALKEYPLNLKIAAKILDIKDEIKTGEFSQEQFPQEDIFKIFAAKIEREIIAFIGSPLKGLQILGLFETRSLNFENVIVLDVNEGALPRLNIYEPLIPREVMISLNLDRLELEEEIQRYQFMRLISSAKNVHLVYQESRDKEKSRFVEELVWEEQKKAGKLAVIDVVRPAFSVKVEARKNEVKKTPGMIEFLKNHRYSASSINTYLRNPMEFYYNYCLGLREKEDLLNEPENRQIGILVHDVLEETFKGFVGREPVIDEKFRYYFQKILDQRFSETIGKSKRSDAFLLKTVLDARMERFLQNEANNPERKVREVLFVEKRFDDVIPLSCGEVKFVYKMDRVDKMINDSIMILDYKTGSLDLMPKNIERIETMELSRESIRDNIQSFQIPLYFYCLDKYFKGQNINAAFYNLRTLEIRRFIDSKMKADQKRIINTFLQPLDYIMSEILNPDISFCEAEG